MFLLPIFFLSSWKKRISEVKASKMHWYANFVPADRWLRTDLHLVDLLFRPVRWVPENEHQQKNLDRRLHAHKIFSVFEGRIRWENKDEAIAFLSTSTDVCFATLSSFLLFFPLWSFVWLFSFFYHFICIYRMTRFRLSLFFFFGFSLFFLSASLPYRFDLWRCPMSLLFDE